MRKNYLKVALRTLSKNKAYVLINVLGLGAALACCIVAYINYVELTDFDRIHADAEHVYRINSIRSVEGETQKWGVTPLALGPAATSDIPGIERFARLTYSQLSVRRGESMFGEGILFADPELLDMLTFPTVMGDPSSIEEPDKIIITRETATRYFGDENPIGQSLDIVYFRQNDLHTVTVGAVVEDPPTNSSIWFDLMMNLSALKQVENWDDANWTYWQQPINFVELAPNVSPETVERQLQRYVPIQQEARPNWPVERFFIQPFHEIGASTPEFEETGLAAPPPLQAVLMLIALAGLILLIACFNFTNTTIALAGTRLREIGLRKALGAERPELIRQYLMETLVLCLPALVAGLLFAWLLANGLASQNMSVEPELTTLFDWRVWTFLAALIGLTGLLAGSYPALYISSFKPTHIFANRSKFKGNNVLTRVLLGAQLTASILAIVAGVIFAQNARYQQNVPLGFNVSEIIGMPATPETIDVFGNQIKSHPKIKSVATTGSQVGVFAYRALFSEDIADAEEHEVYIVDVGPGYLETMDLEIIEGRAFEEREVDYEAAIVNETLLEHLGWSPSEAIGREVLSDNRPYTVIGVVKDFKQFGVRQPIPSVSMHLVPPDRIYAMSIRAEERDQEEVMAFLETEWRETFPNLPFFAGYLEEFVVGQSTEMNMRIASLFFLFALIATALSACGLFALVSLRIVARMKEIGVRKVLGASLQNLLKHISREFVVIMIVALILGSATGYFLSDRLLDAMFAFRMTLDPWAFVVALLTIAFTAIATVGAQVYAAANQNPIETIRTE